MASVLTAKPVNVQVRFRSSFVPPKYDLYKVEISGAMATSLAETYGLKSTDIIVNQGAASSRYLSCRYVLQGEPFRYLDVFVGLDETEIFFSNPATIAELMTEVGRAFKIVTDGLKPVVRGCYFETNLHCETEAPGAQAFVNEMVRAPSGEGAMRKGFTLSTQLGNDSAKFHMEVSDSVQDGLYVVFAFLSKAVFPDVTSYSDMFGSVVEAYRKLQSMASVEILERNADGSFSNRN